MFSETLSAGRIIVKIGTTTRHNLDKKVSTRAPYDYQNLCKVSRMRKKVQKWVLGPYFGCYLTEKGCFVDFTTERGKAQMPLWNDSISNRSVWTEYC